MTKYYCELCNRWHHRGKLFIAHTKYGFYTHHRLQQEKELIKLQQIHINAHEDEINTFPEDLKNYILNPKHRLTIKEARGVNQFPLEIQRSEVIRLCERYHTGIKNFVKKIKETYFTSEQELSSWMDYMERQFGWILQPLS